ncbi:MAG TPA: hypothetical protein VFJ82_11140 [Longimicrobium sp.]|nr:hypothetical protein [Longimicrobium sp.]
MSRTNGRRRTTELSTTLHPESAGDVRVVAHMSKWQAISSIASGTESPTLIQSGPYCGSPPAMKREKLREFASSWRRARSTAASVAAAGRGICGSRYSTRTLSVRCSYFIAGVAYETRTNPGRSTNRLSTSRRPRMRSVTRPCRTKALNPWWVQ